MKITMDKKSEDYRQVKRANQCFLWSILFEVAGIMTMLFWGSIGAQLAIYFMTFVFAFGMARHPSGEVLEEIYLEDFL